MSSNAADKVRLSGKKSYIIQGILGQNTRTRTPTEQDPGAALRGAVYKTDNRLAETLEQFFLVQSINRLVSQSR